MSDPDFQYQPVADDDGQTQLAIGNADGRVVVTLPEPMQWIGMTPRQAVYIAMALMRNAVELEPELADGLPDNDEPTVQ